MSTRRKYEGPRPATAQELATVAPETPPHRSRKDRKRWCRGKVGVEHGEPELGLNGHAAHWEINLGSACGWRTWSLPGMSKYHCAHNYRCPNCGRVLQHSIPERECPDWKPR